MISDAHAATVEAVPLPPTHAGDLVRSLASLADADIRDLGPADLAAVRTLLNDSLFLFAWVVGGCTIMDFTLHGALCEFIQRLGTAPDWMRLMTHIPRDHLKSTLGTLNHALWRITRDPTQPIGIFNHSTENTEQWITGIMSICATPLFGALYADVLPPGVAYGDPRSTPRWWPWSKSSLVFEGRRPGETEHSISGWGTSSSTTGHHWPVMLIDDIVGEKQFRSIPEMEATRSWARGIIHLMRPSSQGVAYVNATPWGYADVSVTFTQELDFRLYRRSALELPDGTPSTEGEPIFPSRFSRAILLREHAKNPFQFWAQRMCVPRPGETSAFDPAWVLYAALSLARGEPIIHFEGPVRSVTTAEGAVETIPNDVPLAHFTLACFLDPACADEREALNTRHARNGFVVEGVDPYGRRVVLESRALRADPKSVLDAAFDLQALWGFTVIYIEEVAFSNTYRHWLRDLQAPGNQYEGRYLVPIGAKTRGKGKEDRILRLVPGLRDGAYYFLRNNTLDIVRELCEYPHSETRDLLDAMAYDYHLRPGSTARAVADEDDWMPGERPGFPRGTRDALTGY